MFRSHKIDRKKKRIIMLCCAIVYTFLHIWIDESNSQSVLTHEIQMYIDLTDKQISANWFLKSKIFSPLHFQSHTRLFHLKVKNWNQKSKTKKRKQYDFIPNAFDLPYLRKTNSRYVCPFSGVTLTYVCLYVFSSLQKSKHNNKNGTNSHD